MSIDQTRLLGITVDIKLSWSAHMLEVRKNFVKKLNILKRSRFLPSDLLLTFYSKVISPSVTYGLIVWGGCKCQDIFNSVEILHCRTARIIFNLPRDMSTLEVLSRSKWTTLEHHYQLSVVKLMFKRKRKSKHSLRGVNILSVPRFNTHFMKQSIAYRGATLWNAIAWKDQVITNATEISSFVREVSKTNTFQDFNFNTFSVQTTNNRIKDFIYI